MIGSELLDYIKQCRASGFTDDQIKAELAKAGWSQDDINEAFSIGIAQPTATVPAQASKSADLQRQSQSAGEVKLKPKKRFLTVFPFVFGAIVIVGVFGFFIWNLSIKEAEEVGEVDLMSKCKNFNHNDLKTTFACQNDKYVVLSGETGEMPLCDKVNFSLALETDSLAAIHDLAGLACLKSLTMGYFSHNKTLPDLANLASALPNLETLTIQGYTITDPSEISNLNNLRTINLYGVTLPSLDFVSSLRDLISINLIGVGATDLTPLTKIHKLRSMTVLMDEFTVAQLYAVFDANPYLIRIVATKNDPNYFGSGYSYSYGLFNYGAGYGYGYDYLIRSR